MAKLKKRRLKRGVKEARQPVETTATAEDIHLAFLRLFAKRPTWEESFEAFCILARDMGYLAFMLISNGMDADDLDDDMHKAALDGIEAAWKVWVEQGGKNQ